MKKCIVVFVLALVGMSAQAAYLFWQVDQTDYSTIYSGSDVEGVTLYAFNGTDVHSQNAVVGNRMSFDLGSSSWDNYSFYVEVARSDGSVVATSEGNAENYANLGAYIGSTSELSTVPMAQVWHGGAMAAPEPTSGFLMMVGLALLGLKRRKV